MDGGYRLLLDEHIDPEVTARLADLGHDVEHVDVVPELGKGATDAALAAYSLETDRAIVTFDDDFIREVDTDQYRAVLFFEDDSVSSQDVSEIIHAMSDRYPFREVRGLQKTGREWQ